MFGNKVGHLGRVGSLTLAQRVSAMFSRGEPGAWYDPSDLSTLFQDAAGSTPVTAVEQPVGRILDKSGRGNHATQATTTKRPVLSRRVNLLTKTEQFDDAAWSKSSCSITANATTAPDGTTTADLMVPNAASGFRYIAQSTTAAYTTSRIFVKSAGLPYVAFGNAAAAATLNFASGTLNKSSDSGQLFSVVALADDWFEVSCTNTTAAAYQVQCFAGVNASGAVVATDGVSGIYLCGASLTLATDAHLPYQWVNTATDYDADPAKFPAYLSFDGVDDALQTGNIDFTSTDKMTVWAGVTKIGDAVRNPIIEVGGYGVAQGFGLYSSPQGATNQIQAFHAAANPVYVYAAATPPNANYVLGLQSDLSAPKIAMRRSGAAAAESTASPGVGAYGNLPASIGSGTGGFYFNGRLYNLIVRGAQTPLSQIEATELYIKQKMRMS